MPSISPTVLSGRFLSFSEREETRSFGRRVPVLFAPPGSRFSSSRCSRLMVWAQHRNLVAQYQEFNLLGSAVAGELGQNMQHLAHLFEPDRFDSELYDLG